MGYARVIHKKESIEKMDKCPNYQNNGYLDARLKKREMNKIAHIFLQMFSSFRREISFQGA
jgi:hypothetical protein